MCGRGLSVFGAGKVAAVGDGAGFAVCTEVLLLFALPESSLGVLVVRACLVFSAWEAMVERFDLVRLELTPRTTQ